MSAIEAYDYCTVVSDKKLRKFGLSRGDEVMIVGTKPTVVSADDPYTKRDYMVVVIVKDGLVQLPKEGNEYRSYLLDPKSLEKVNDERRRELHEALEKQYGKVRNSLPT